MEHLEGRQSVLAALKAFQRRFQVILLRHGIHEEDAVQEIAALAAERNVPIRYVDSKELDAMAHAGSHGGVLAVVSPKPRMSGVELLEMIDALREPALLLLIEGIEDARNLGFVLRTAEAMGVHAVLIKKHLWDLDTVEIARPASGAYERIPLVQIENVDVLEQLQRRGLKLYGCVANAKRRIYDLELNKPSILAIGGEKRGLSGAVRSICNRLMTIPTAGGASSLSLSHAAAIVVAEALRQRLPPRSEFSDQRSEFTDPTTSHPTAPDLPSSDPDPME